MKNYRKESVRVQLASGAATDKVAAGVLTLRNDVRVVGYALYEDSSPGVPYHIQIKDNRETISDYAPHQDYEPGGASLHPNERYAPLNLDSNISQNLTVSAKVLNTTTGDLDITMVFLIEESQDKAFC